MKRSLTVLGLLLVTLWSGPSLAATWTVDHAASRLGFVATWEGSAFEGVFKHFEADVVFDPAAPSKGHFDVTIDVTSADTDSPDRDEALGGEEWFDFRHYPKATFVTSAISPAAAGYEAIGTLTIKGVSRSIVLPFSWKQTGGRAHMLGSVVIRRTDFRIGEGEWASADGIGLDVKVTVDLSLQAEDG